MTENFKNIKKGTKLITTQLGRPTRAIALESIRQGKGFKKTLLVDVKGSDVGLFDECGSIYIDDIADIIDDATFNYIGNEIKRRA
tara:strand:+ start:112 stop:366 length:255 start_codon:yes stop_codon:yes gene_type:complete